MRGLFWFPLGAAILMMVVAIVFGSPKTDAADCLESVASFSGHVQDTDAYEFDYCDDASLNLTASLLWGNAHKDLALRLTSPSGDIYFEDSHGGFFESVLVGGPAQGTWTVEVINNGHGNVAYGLTVAAGY